PASRCSTGGGIAGRGRPVGALTEWGAGAARARAPAPTPPGPVGGGPAVALFSPGASGGGFTGELGEGGRPHWGGLSGRRGRSRLVIPRFVRVVHGGAPVVSPRRR